MAFTAVGTQQASAVNTAQSTISVITTNLGDLVVMFTVLLSTTISVTTMTGGGCGTWTQAGTAVSDAIPANLQMWYGTVATAGTANATMTFSSAIGTLTRIAAYQQFSAGLGSTTVWSVDASGQLANTASSAVTYPTLTPSSGTDLYMGYSQAASAATVGSTAGYVYQHISATTFPLLVYNLAVSAASHPASTQASSGLSLSTAALFKAALPSGSPRLMNINQAVNRASSF